MKLSLVLLASLFMSLTAFADSTHVPTSNELATEATMLVKLSTGRSASNHEVKEVKNLADKLIITVGYKSIESGAECKKDVEYSRAAEGRVTLKISTATCKI